MTAEIVRLGQLGPVIEPDADLIQDLTRLLDMAKRGEIKGFGYFFVKANDNVAYGYTPASASGHDMVAGAAYLQHMVITSASDRQS